ncbi:MAG: fatty-acyl-CoA synthase [Candidatus Azotimanducaceae bacterium]|jgi:fatty-acyl-CoA synthase
MATADLNFGDLLEKVAAAIPEKPAIVHGNNTLSWREFDERSNRLAHHLVDMGLKPGSKVAFYLRNTPAYLELFFACVKARLTHANVNYRYVDHELFHVLDNSDAEAVVYDAEFQTQIDALAPRLDKVRTFLRTGSSFEAACTEGDASPLQIERSGKDLYFMYTGGTTGYPKAVMWQHEDRVAVIGMTEATTATEHGQQIKESSAGPVVLAACPLMHSTGFTTSLSTLVSGGCVVLLPTPAFNAEICLQEIQKHKVERMAIVGDAFSVPILEHLRLHANDYDLSSVSIISSAGAMWSAHRKLELLKYFKNATLADSLGSSEGSKLGASTTKAGDTSATGSFLLGPRTKIFTEDFREVEPGTSEAGMIATSGNIPLGYYKDEARTEKTFPTINGVRYSMAGDWCTLDADGSMALLGRGNNCINSGGEKIYPEEVEEALKTMAEVHDAAVIGIPDERWGQAVVAVIHLRSEESLESTKIREHLIDKLARYKHPKQVIFVSDSFRHDNGKVNYRAVNALLPN